MNFLEKYNIKINNTLLLSEALTHSSYAYENNINSYEKLEFLGDAVLSVIVSEYLYNKHNLKEGQMTKIRASYVCEDALNVYAKEVGYADLIKVGNGLHVYSVTPQKDGGSLDSPKPGKSKIIIRNS